MSYTSVAGPNVYTQANATALLGGAAVLLPFIPYPAGDAVDNARAQGLTVDSTSVFVQGAAPGALRCQLSGLYSINWRIVGSTSTVNSLDTFLSVTRYGIAGSGSDGIDFTIGQNTIGYTAITTVGTAKASGSAVVYLNSGDVLGVYAHTENAMDANRGAGATDIFGSYVAIELLA